MAICKPLFCKRKLEVQLCATSRGAVVARKSVWSGCDENPLLSQNTRKTQQYALCKQQFRLFQAAVSLGGRGAGGKQKVVEDECDNIVLLVLLVF